jgi:hypothetical protein
VSKVIKESFIEASVRIDEEFDNAKLAAESNSFGENAKVKVLDFKVDKSRIKLINKEQDVRSKGDTGTKEATGGGS